VKVLLADDHGLFRDSMAVWLNHLEENLDIHFSGNYEEVTNQLENNIYELILLDLGMPGMQGVISIKYFCSLAKDTPIIIVSADESPITISACINAGAVGYVTKASSGETILNAIKKVLSGSKYIPVTTNLENPPKLNSKQQQILALIIDGCSNKVISYKLNLSEGTVKQYVSQLLHELNVDNRTQAANKARELLGIGRS